MAIRPAPRSYPFAAHRASELGAARSGRRKRVPFAPARRPLPSCERHRRMGCGMATEDGSLSKGLGLLGNLQDLGNAVRNSEPLSQSELAYVGAELAAIQAELAAAAFERAGNPVVAKKIRQAIGPKRKRGAPDRSAELRKSLVLVAIEILIKNPALKERSLIRRILQRDAWSHFNDDDLRAHWRTHLQRLFRGEPKPFELFKRLVRLEANWRNNSQTENGS